MNSPSVKNKKLQGKTRCNKQQGTVTNKSRALAHRWKWAKGYDEYKGIAKLKKARVTQFDYLREAAHGAPIPARRTLTKWISECGPHATFEEYEMAYQIHAGSSGTVDGIPIRKFGNKEMDDINLQTFCNFDLVSKNCLNHARAGSMVVASLPHKDAFCMREAVHYMESERLLLHPISQFEGYNLPASYPFALDLITARETSLTAQTSIHGAKLPNYKMEPNRCYEARLDGVNTIIAWPTICWGSGGKLVWNYGSLQHLHHSDEDVDWYMRHESLEMQAVHRYTTAGPRVGPQQALPVEYDKFLNEKWFRPSTERNRKYLHKGHGVNPCLQYDSLLTGTATCPRQVQRRVVGIKRGTDQVRRMLVDYPAYRRISLAEEHQRLCFQVFVCCYPLPQNELGVEHDNLCNGDPRNILHQVNEALEAWHKNKDYIVGQWRQYIPTHCMSDFEMFLLELKCMNGTLLQFDQLACHNDKSAFERIESTKLIAKVNPHDERQPSRLVRDTMETGMGQTMVPFIDRAFSFRPVRDRGNFHLDGSPHIGDDSRGVTNAHEGNHGRCQ